MECPRVGGASRMNSAEPSLSSKLDRPGQVGLAVSAPGAGFMSDAAWVGSRE